MSGRENKPATARRSPVAGSPKKTIELALKTKLKKQNRKIFGHSPACLVASAVQRESQTRAQQGRAEQNDGNGRCDTITVEFSSSSCSFPSSGGAKPTTSREEKGQSTRAGPSHTGCACQTCTSIPAHKSLRGSASKQGRSSSKIRCPACTTV